MKVLINKPTGLPLENGQASYFDLARICVNATAPQGLSIGEIEKRLRVLNALSANQKQADLEDADFDTLKSCVEGMRWNMVSQEIADFVNYIRKEGGQPDAVA